jgi:hypothetical protein
MSERGYTVNQDDYTMEPVRTWEDEVRERWRKDDVRMAKIVGRHIPPVWFHYAVCILEPLGI